MTRDLWLVWRGCASKKRFSAAVDADRYALLLESRLGGQFGIYRCDEGPRHWHATRLSRAERRAS